MSAFINTHESTTASSLPQMEQKKEYAGQQEKQAETIYNVSPETIYCESLNSYYYDKTDVDNLVFIGMCNLYEKVIPETKMTSEIFNTLAEIGVQPPKPHMPFHTTITDQSYMYTSEYKHNKLDVMIMEQQPKSVNQQMYVRFTIVPKYSPTIESEEECAKIESLVLDNIYEKVQGHFEYIEQEEYERIHAKDEHSYPVLH
jgi:hypothetical protein